MYSKFRRGLAISAALATFALGASARATTVQFYTEGLFNSDAATLQTGDVQTDSVVSGGSTIVYANGGLQTKTFDNIGATLGIAFGNFTLTSTSLSTFTNVPFTLELFSVSPDLPGHQSLVGSVSGTINGSSSGVNVSFPSSSFYVPPEPDTQYIYSLDNTSMMLNTNSPNDPISGTVTELPLPSTASAGLVALAGLGTLGGLKKLRQRNAASLAV